MTPEDELFTAAAAGDVAAVRSALQRGASADAIREFETGGERCIETGSETALHLAIANGHRDVVKLLAIAGADLRRLDWRTRDDALSAAVARGDLALAKVLREHGAGPNERALLHACRLGRTDLIPICLGDSVRLDNSPALAEAARFDQVATMDWLLANGVDVAQRGGEALVAAVHAGHLAAADWLLRHGAPLTFRNEYAWPVLHFAAWGGHLELVDRLLDGGADPQAPCGHGRSARSWAEEAGHAAVAARLLQRGG